MAKTIVGGFVALLIASAALVPQAQARCWWNGFAYRCVSPYAGYWHHRYYRPYAYYHHPYHYYGYHRGYVYRY